MHIAQTLSFDPYGCLLSDLLGPGWHLWVDSVPQHRDGAYSPYSEHDSDQEFELEGKQAPLNACPASSNLTSPSSSPCESKEILLLQVHTIYMGIVDIYFGTFRMLRASSKIAMRTNKWRTFKPLGHSPVMTMITFIMNVQLELGVAIAGACTLVFFNWGSLSSRDYGMLGFLGLIITFPLYTLLTAVHKGSKSALLDSKLAKEKLVDDDGTLAAMSRILWADKQVEKGGYDSAAVDQKSTASSPLDLNMASPLSPASAQRQANDNLWSSISRVAG